MRLIDGDALSDWLKDYGQKCIKGERKISLMYVWKHIQDMQTIEPERKTGKWITKSTNGEIFDCCSICGYVEWDEPKNFCPACGADMRGDQP